MKRTVSDDKRGARLPSRDTVAGAWRCRAACRDLRTDQFYPRKDDSPEVIELARSVCRSCQVTDDCLSEAFANGEKFGIWGGLLPEERERLRRQRKIPRGTPPPMPFPHGTNAGHKRHQRDGSRICDDCARAHRLYKAEFDGRKS